jgi:hypothetical protein
VSRLNQSGSHTGYPRCPVVSWRDIIPSNEGRKPGPAPLGFSSLGAGLRHHLGGASSASRPSLNAGRRRVMNNGVGNPVGGGQVPPRMVVLLGCTEALGGLRRRGPADWTSHGVPGLMGNHGVPPGQNWGDTRPVATGRRERAR